MDASSPEDSASDPVAPKSVESAAIPHIPVSFDRKLHRRRLGVDGLAAKFVIVGGIAVIGSILAILVVIAWETWPLFAPPHAEKSGNLTIKTEGQVFAVGADEYQEVGFVLHSHGVRCFNFANGEPIPDFKDTFPLKGATILAASVPERGEVALGLSDGRVLIGKIGFRPTFPDGADGIRIIVPYVTCDRELQLKTPSDGPTPRPVAMAFRKGDEGSVAAVSLDNGELWMIQTSDAAEDEDFVGELVEEEDTGPSITQIPIETQGKITTLALTEESAYLCVGTSRGHLMAVNISDPKDTKVAHELSATSASTVGISKMAMLLGARTLIVGDRDGKVSSWQLVRNAANRYRLAQVNTYASHGDAVIAIDTSGRDKGFITGAADGSVKVHYGTTGVTLLEGLQGDGGNSHGAALTPKANGIVSLASDGTFSRWKLENHHPEITFNSLFGRVWYESYTEPDYVWQSSGMTDAFEAKLSLTPLIVGTLKGTFYALIFAIPLALMGALYASQFMHPRLRESVKSIIEIMAALPSVVLGFLAGLWLAPKVEAVAPGIFLMVLLTPATILAALLIWERMPDNIKHRIRPGYELLLLVPMVVVGVLIALQAGEWINVSLLGGDYRSWLLDSFDINYDQRNSIVVGIAMGVAVIPIIFTISEDSLSNVPQHLKAGALALGSTPWQAAVRVILPTASPGIFSAIMIGFGRAVGETMIVLMATGNTPVMDLSAFSGFRALSANIAVELPEAPHGHTHYRVLFLAALLLFGMTFIVNTAAEVVRLRLRRKYSLL